VDYICELRQPHLMNSHTYLQHQVFLYSSKWYRRLFMQLGQWTCVILIWNIWTSFTIEHGCNNCYNEVNHSLLPVYFTDSGCMTLHGTDGLSSQIRSIRFVVTGTRKRPPASRSACRGFQMLYLTRFGSAPTRDPGRKVLVNHFACVGVPGSPVIRTQGFSQPFCLCWSARKPCNKNNSGSIQLYSVHTSAFYKYKHMYNSMESAVTVAWRRMQQAPPNIMLPLLLFPFPVPFPPFWSALAIARPTWNILVLTLTEITDIFWIAYQPFIQNSMFVCYFRISVPVWLYHVNICGLKCWCSSSGINTLVTFTFESFMVLLLLNMFQAVVIIRSVLRQG
jgi:hypothetical protein